ncbi:hypothetical protein BH11BAC4_BH11BAC4_05810 [soil metagenome]
MKKIVTRILIIVFFTGFSNVQYAQTIPNFDLIKLEKVSDFKSAEPFALQTANYLLSNPIKKGSTDRVKSLEFLFKWMSGTPGYSYNFDEARTSISKGNTEILGIYMAALVKYTLENKDSTHNPKLVKLNAVTLLLNYCENKNNNIKMPKQLKAFAEARAKGTLEQEL